VLRRRCVARSCVARTVSHTPLSGYLGAAFIDLTALTGTVGYWFWLLRTEVSREASWYVLPYVGESHRSIGSPDLC
jgi:hypothetical protein